MKFFAGLAILFFGLAAYSVSITYTPVNLKWDQPTWSTELRKDITADLPQFKQAKGWDSYCPNFSSLQAGQQIDVVATMAVAISDFESAYNPKSVAIADVAGIDSIGLFQLSYPDGFSWCKLDPKTKTLLDPINNIDCAIGEMAHLMQKDGVVSSGGKADFKMGAERGLARYWSTMWSDSKRAQIMQATLALPFCH